MDEDELDILDVSINDDATRKEQYDYEKGLNIIEETQEPVSEEGVYITEEEDNNEVENTDKENNEEKM